MANIIIPQRRQLGAIKPRQPIDFTNQIIQTQGQNPLAEAIAQVGNIATSAIDRRNKLAQQMAQTKAISDTLGIPSEAVTNLVQQGVDPKMAYEVGKTLAAKKAPKDQSLEAKFVLHNGQVTPAGYDKSTNAYYQRTPAGNVELTGDIQPYSATGTQSDITDADRKRLKPLAQAVIEGRGSPNQLVNMRSGDKEKLALVASELDPTFDLSVAPQRTAIRKDFTPAGTSGKALTSLNTVIGHLDTLGDKIAALDNTQIPKYNSIANYLKSNAGKPEVKEFNSVKNFVNNELGKIAQGSGVITNSERSEISDAIDASSSPQQAQGVIDSWIDIIKSRTDAIKSNWEQTLPGVKTPVPIINDKSKKLLIKHGYDPNTLEKTGNPSGPTSLLQNPASASKQVTTRRGTTFKITGK